MLLKLINEKLANEIFRVGIWGRVAPCIRPWSTFIRIIFHRKAKTVTIIRT